MAVLFILYTSKSSTTCSKVECFRQVFIGHFFGESKLGVRRKFHEIPLTFLVTSRGKNNAPTKKLVHLCSKLYISTEDLARKLWMVIFKVFSAGTLSIMPIFRKDDSTDCWDRLTLWIEKEVGVIGILCFFFPNRVF